MPLIGITKPARIDLVFPTKPRAGALPLAWPISFPPVPTPTFVSIWKYKHRNNASVHSSATLMEFVPATVFVPMAPTFTLLRRIWHIFLPFKKVESSSCSLPAAIETCINDHASSALTAFPTAIFKNRAIAGIIHFPVRDIGHLAARKFFHFSSTCLRYSLTLPSDHTSIPVFQVV